MFLKYLIHAINAFTNTLKTWLQPLCTRKIYWDEQLRKTEETRNSQTFEKLGAGPKQTGTRVHALKSGRLAMSTPECAWTVWSRESVLEQQWIKQHHDCNRENTDGQEWDRSRWDKNPTVQRRSLDLSMNETEMFKEADIISSELLAAARRQKLTKLAMRGGLAPRVPAS